MALRRVVPIATVLILGQLAMGCSDGRRHGDAGQSDAGHSDAGPPDGSCRTDADCLSEEYCDADGFCSDTLDYMSCFDSADCIDQDCVEVTTTAGTNGTLCTFGCTSSSECPANRGNPGACYDPGGAFICFQTCVDDFDCEANNGCVSVIRTDGLEDFICIPGA